MKRFFHFMTVIALAALTLTGCDDVPMPYNQPNIKPNEPSGTSSLPYSDSNLKDWTVSTVTGADWSLGSTYAKATGYNGGTTTATETWLVSPTINTTSSDGAVINFDHVIRYVQSATDINNHEMYISSDYTGDVKTATWTKLDYKPVESATQTWDFYAADPIQIPDAYLNKDVVIAFKFTCNDQNSTTWEIKNFSVKEGKAETGGGDTPTPGEKGSSKDNPLSTSEAVDIINSGNIPATEVYVKGIISSVDFYNSEYHSISYYLSDDGKSKVLDVYSGKGLNGANFANKNDLQVGQTVIVKGKLYLYEKDGKKTPEIDKNSQIVSIEGGNTPTEKTGFSETFSASQGDFTIENVSMSEGLKYVWKWNNSKYMKASAFVNNKKLPAQSRLVSPAFSLKGVSKPTLTFEHTGKYFSSNIKDDIRVQVSTDGKTWQDLTISAYPTGNDWNFVKATADLSAFAGQSTVYIAFLYTSTENAACSWEIKNVVVK